MSTGGGGCCPPSCGTWSSTDSENLNNAGYYTQGHANDLAILILGKEFNMNMDLMHGALKLVEDWCNVEGLRVNKWKTALIHFTYKRRDRNITPILFGEWLTW
jgi:hypothetical protein